MHTLLLLIVLATATNYHDLFDKAKEAILSEHCPFHDLKGLHPLCANTPTTKFKVKLGTGWDPIKAQIRLPLFNFTYEHDQRYTYNYTIYAIPDQVTGRFVSTNATESTVVHNVYSTIDEYLTQMNPSRSNIVSGTLSLPVDVVPDLFHFFGSGQNFIISTTESVRLFNMSLIDANPMINSFTQAAIDSLPVIYNEEIYSLFIEYWGTQVVIGGIAGGTAEQTVMIRNCLGGIDVVSQAALGLLKALHPGKYANVNVDARFQQYSRANISNIWGGNPSIINNWEKRMETIAAYPVLTEVRTVPITNFIKNETIKNNLQKAIDSYYASGSTNLAQYRQAYLNQAQGPKIVTGFSMINGAILSTFQYNLYPGGSVANYKSGGIVHNPGGSKYSLPVNNFEAFGCSHTSTYGVKSWVDMGAVGAFVGTGVGVDSVASGSDAMFGCSGSSYRIKIKGYPVPSHYTFVGAQHACCMDCIPDVRCDGSGCHLTQCVCPPF